MNKPLKPGPEENGSVAAFKSFLRGKGIEEAAADFLTGFSFSRKVGRGKHLLKTGEVCSYYYFISKGLLRGYVRENHKEITVWVAVEGQVITSYSSLLEGRRLPSTSSIQAIEETVVLCIPAEVVERACQQFAPVNTLARILLEEHLQEAAEKSVISSLSTAEKKYSAYLLNYPHLSNRLPLKYVASLLGMTVETLSRIRRKKVMKKTKMKIMSTEKESQKPL